ncbi:ribosomal protein L37ae [Cladorrhinum samala]|uniref:Ribosomal protein L37ae n=1 Tax=Cladorrhinum samala TaxID=585594 RepID=A0AAV9I2A8_9PEZI|nr:ribosomal protein L37ae [Cladorrhinum samala]
MTKHTKKVGITGKYGVRYGASLRKQLRRLETAQHAKYIWYDRLSHFPSILTPAAASARSTLRRLRELQEGPAK